MPLAAFLGTFGINCQIVHLFEFSLLIPLGFHGSWGNRCGLAIGLSSSFSEPVVHAPDELLCEQTQ